MTETQSHRGLTGRAAEDCERAERKSMAQVLSQTLARVAVRTEREIMFQRRGLPATVPAWAREIADDKTVTNLRTLLNGAYLNAMIADERHAKAHQQPRLYCPCCIAKKVTGRSEWTIAY